MKTFNPLNVSSKFAICGLPIRVDSYKTCSFSCAYCFSNYRKIMEFDKHLQIGDVNSVERRLNKIFDKHLVKNNSLLDTLISQKYTWHFGGMSDPFQPCESRYNITKSIVDICNKYDIHILFSTKSDSFYSCDVNPCLHSFQLSVSNVDNRKDIEPNVKDISIRYDFFRRLKNDGFKVGIRIQPFIPNITTLEIVKMFKDADHFTLEGLKLVPQNKNHKDNLLRITRLKGRDFKQMGLLNLRPEIRLKMYQPFIEYFEKNGLSYSLADNDFHHMGNNKCCCGDALIRKSTSFNNTAMSHVFGEDYCKEQVDEQLFCESMRDCKCNHLFTSNRQEGCVSVQDFYDKRF